MDKQSRYELIKLVCTKLNALSASDTEELIMSYCLNKKLGHPYMFNDVKLYEYFTFLEDINLPTDLEVIIEIFEAMIDGDSKNENGIVFTPKYISNYITKNLFVKEPLFLENIKIIDPGCGCGIFLISAIERIHYLTNAPINKIIKENIYGIDLKPDNVKRCKMVLKLLCEYHNCDIEYDDINIVCEDSLKVDWCELFNTTPFEFVIGNPPYVNTHDMNKDTVKFLKANYKTTKTGVFNIFFAFVEKSMHSLSPDGCLGFIVPNNFLTISAAQSLRNFLQTGKYISKIIDFGNNMVFKPVRTYNCLLFLQNNPIERFNYSLLDDSENIELALENTSFMEMCTEDLDDHAWKLVDRQTHNNLLQIEQQDTPIKSFIRTGIATLKDAAYFVLRDDDGYYKILSTGEKIYLEDGLIKTIYKIPELKQCANVDDVARYIIFPYVKGNTGFTLISEDVFVRDYPNTYKALENEKELLATRDKGRPNPYAWYAYGRTQGLNKYGRKLLFPTFSNSPNFIFIEDDSALFCNGYAVFENELLPLEIIQRILNSVIMDYYVKNTSYSIEGGYFCYQKKYIERFSIPKFTKEELELIISLSKTELDAFLIEKYGLKDVL